MKVLEAPRLQRRIGKVLLDNCSSITDWKGANLRGLPFFLRIWETAHDKLFRHISTNSSYGSSNFPMRSIKGFLSFAPSRAYTTGSLSDTGLLLENNIQTVWQEAL